MFSRSFSYHLLFSFILVGRKHHYAASAPYCCLCNRDTEYGGRPGSDLSGFMTMSCTLDLYCAEVYTCRLILEKGLYDFHVLSIADGESDGKPRIVT